APTMPYPLSLHDTLPIYEQRRPDAALHVARKSRWDGDYELHLAACQQLVDLRFARRLADDAEVTGVLHGGDEGAAEGTDVGRQQDRKSTRLNSSHVKTSY